MSERFHRLINENARASVRDEPGCRQFDVVVAEGEPDSVLLYEIYDDKAAFAAHTKTPHFAAFDRDSASCVASKKVSLGTLVYAGSDG
jgi:(4S)-4-hydroxy-5-phosphonooxypentane-2,3-dione isomerase